MGWKEGLQLAIFFMSWVPIGMILITNLLPIAQPYPTFSIYNTEYTGLSDYRRAIEAEGYDVAVIQSSMSVISRYEGDAVLVIMGPVRGFATDLIPLVGSIMEHIANGGSVFIADDFGKTNESFITLNLLLFSEQQQILGHNITSFVAFNDGVLLDLDSYDKSPKLPIITTFTPGMTDGSLTTGVSELHLNWASTLRTDSAIGSAGIAWSTRRAWCERDVVIYNNETEEYEPNMNPYPDGNEPNGTLPVAGAIAIPQGLAPGTTPGRIVVMTDPTAFTNDMWGFAGNRRFGINIINWLAQNNRNMTIVFGEHLLETPITSAEFFYGQFLGRILWMTAQQYLAPIYPIMTAIGIKKYLPDLKKPEVRSVSEVFMRRGTTYFGERMAYYKSEGNYGRVIKMLYRKLRRDIRRKHSWREYSVTKVWDLMRSKDLSIDEKSFMRQIERIETIANKPSIKIRETELMGHFFFMRNIAQRLVNIEKR
jgi:hypothetical protein